MNSKLLICLPYLTPSIGGGAMVLINLLEPLAAEGFDVIVVYFQARAESLIPSQFKSYALVKHVGKARYYFEYPRVIFEMARILRRENPDAILCNAYQPLGVVRAAERLLGLKIPVLAGEQNNLSLMFQGARMGRLRFYLTRKLDFSAAALIAPGRGLARRLGDDLGIGTEKIHVVYNPIPVDSIRESAQAAVAHPWFKNKDKPVLINVGVLGDQKDQKTLLRAFCAARKTVPSRLVFVGDGPLLSELRNEAHVLGMDEDVAFLGFQDNPFKFMSKADVFVLSSRYEGFGLVLPEAMACGCPVVSTDCDYGPREIITDQVNGLLSPVASPEALAFRIIKVLSDQALRKTLIDGGLKRAQDFSADIIAGQYAEILRRINARRL